MSNCNQQAVHVPAPSGSCNLQEGSFTSNGIYTPDSGYDGFSKVTVTMESADGKEF